MTGDAVKGRRVVFWLLAGIAIALLGTYTFIVASAARNPPRPVNRMPILPRAPSGPPGDAAPERAADR